MRNKIKVKVNKTSALFKYDGQRLQLYWLEEYFGIECDGHGCGLTGEDICFIFNETRKGYKQLDFCLNGRTLEIEVWRWDENENGGDKMDDITFSDLPSEILTKLKLFLRYHCKAGSVAKVAS